MTVMVYAPPETTPATISRGERGVLVVEVNQMFLGERPHLADAVHALCEHAIRFQQTLVVTVASGAGKQYMTIDTNGAVAPSAAPAPSAAERRRRGLGTPANLGHSPNAQMTQTEWVERFILDPTAGGTKQPAPAGAGTQVPVTAPPVPQPVTRTAPTSPHVAPPVTQHPSDDPFAFLPPPTLPRPQPAAEAEEKPRKKGLFRRG